MPRGDGWRARIVPAVLSALLLLAPLVVMAHVHASHRATSSSCLLCTAADHGVSDVPVVAHVASQATTLRSAGPAAPTTLVVRPLAASAARGPPAFAAPLPC